MLSWCCSQPSPVLSTWSFLFVAALIPSHFSYSSLVVGEHWVVIATALPLAEEELRVRSALEGVCKSNTRVASV